MSKRIMSLVFFCGIVLLFAACGQTATPIPTTVIQPTAAAAGDYVPIAEAECTALQQDLTTVLGVEVNQGTTPFEDYLTGGRGTCCLLRAVGTGEDFPNELALIANLQLFFEDQGWVVDGQYTANVPNGTAFGLRQDNALALVSVVWTPTADADCPTDQPMSSCNLAPGQIVYIIRARLAKK